MKQTDVVVIPYGEKAVLRIRKDKIVATVSVPNSNTIDIYTADTANPWHIQAPADAIVGLIWEGE